MQFNTTLKPKHFQNTFVEIRPANKQRHIVNEKFEIVEREWNNKKEYRDLQVRFINNARLVFKKTILKEEFNTQDSYLCYDCPLNIGLQILDYYYPNDNILLDVLTFNNLSLC